MEGAENLPESVAPWLLAEGVSSAAADRVRQWWERARRAYPANTQRAWRFDWVVFLAYCQPLGRSPLPASPETVAGFIEACRVAGKKPATIRRYLSTIALAHRVAKLGNPCADEAVQLELKGLYNVLSARQRQAKALGWAEIRRFIDLSLIHISEPTRPY